MNILNDNYESSNFDYTGVCKKAVEFCGPNTSGRPQIVVVRTSDRHLFKDPFSSYHLPGDSYENK